MFIIFAAVLNRFISISLLFLFLGNSLLKTMLIVDYWYRSKEITETCCINKNKPELNCHGKCFVDVQLNKIDHKTEKQPEGRSLINDRELFIVPSTENLRTPAHIALSYADYRSEHYHFLFSMFVFQPPTV